MASHAAHRLCKEPHDRQEALLLFLRTLREAHHAVDGIDRARQREEKRHLDVALLVALVLDQRNDCCRQEEERDDREDRARLPDAGGHPDHADHCEEACDEEHLFSVM